MGVIGQINEKEWIRPILVFFVKILSIYFFWRLFTILIGQEAEPIQDRFIPALSYYWEAFNSVIRKNLIYFTMLLLKLFGFGGIVIGKNIIKIEGFSGVGVGNYCLALELFVLFCALVISYPAKLKHKLWFLPFGLISIHVLNVFRVFGLSLMTVYMPESADFNHHFTFRIVVFVYILIIYYWFISKYGTSK